MNFDFEDCCRILDVQTDTTLDAAKSSYRELVKVWHPDRFAHDPALQLKAQEKLKKINLAFERLQQLFSEAHLKAQPKEPEPEREPDANELFTCGQALYFGDGVQKNTILAFHLLLKAAELGVSNAQYIVGHAYNNGEGTDKNTDEAVMWWKRASELKHASSQYSLAFVYHRGHSSGVIAKVVKGAVNWEVGDTKIEAYKWANLAITYGFGLKAGLLKDEISLCMNEPQRNEARKRASLLYPEYPKYSNDAILDKLFEWFLEEGGSPSHMSMGNFYSKMQSKTGGIHKFSAEVRKHALEHLKTTFFGNSVSKTGGYFKTIGAGLSFNRSNDDWGRIIARSLVDFPYDYLSDNFIRRRENAINHIWLNFSRA